jgi:CHAD domain-containing protein
MTNLLHTSLDERWQKYNLQLANCRTAFSEDAVHDVRVATRRLLATLELIDAVVLKSKTRKLRRALKNQLDSFDDLRDTQVMLAEVAARLSSIPELQPFLIRLQKRERRLLRKAQKNIQALDTDKLEKRLIKILETLWVNAETSESLLSALDGAFSNVTRRAGKVDPSIPATIHRVRIAFKAFRYMLEIVHPILPGFPKKLLRQMQDYQTRMGDIQDVEVFLRNLDDFAARAKSYAPDPARHFYEQRHTDLISAYLAEKGRLAGFWRAATEMPFPWEKSHEPLHSSPRNRRRAGSAGDGRQPAPPDSEGTRENASDSAQVEIS